MQRIKVILLAPRTSEPHHRELAMGMHGVWVCALHAAGAHVFGPLSPLEPDRDPFTGLGGVMGAALLHDGEPLRGNGDVAVSTELSCGEKGWRCRVTILRRDGSEVVLPGRTHGNVSGALDVMNATLHAIAHGLGLDVPEEFGWREMLRVHTVARGLEVLHVEGRQALRRADGIELGAVVD